MHQLLDQSKRLLIGKNLSTFGRSAKARRQVSDVAHRSIIQLTLKADITHRCMGVPLLYLNQGRILFLHPLFFRSSFHSITHPHTQAYGLLCVILAGHGVIEENHQSVPDKVLDGSPEFKDQLAHFRVIGSQ